MGKDAMPESVCTREERGIRNARLPGLGHVPPEDNRVSRESAEFGRKVDRVIIRREKTAVETAGCIQDDEAG